MMAIRCFSVRTFLHINIGNAILTSPESRTISLLVSLFCYVSIIGFVKSVLPLYKFDINV